MWAAIKSDLKEFVSTAAEETNAAANKAASSAGISANVRNSSNTGGDSGRWGVTLEGVGASVMGLSSMIGGVVAPHPAPRSESATFGEDIQDDYSSKLVSARREDDEEELRWDDDDEDELNVNETAEVADTANPSDAMQNSEEDDLKKNYVETGDHDSTIDILATLQTKLSLVEKERNDLQLEHRKQTAILVELRSKIEEINSVEVTGKEENDVMRETVADAEGTGMESLRNQVRDLKLLLEQCTNMPSESEYEVVIASLIKEKETLEQELNNQKRVNEELQAQYLTSENNDHTLLQQYHDQIQVLTTELELLQLRLNASQTELNGTKEQFIQEKQEYFNSLQQYKEELQRTQAHAPVAERSLVEIEASHTLAIQQLDASYHDVTNMKTEQDHSNKQLNHYDKEDIDDEAITDNNTNDKSKKNSNKVPEEEEDDWGGVWEDDV